MYLYKTSYQHLQGREGGREGKKEGEIHVKMRGKERRSNRKSILSISSLHVHVLCYLNTIQVPLSDSSGRRVESVLQDKGVGER